MTIRWQGRRLRPVAALAGAAVAAALAGCGGDLTKTSTYQPPTLSASPTVTNPVQASDATVNARVCFDDTGSTSKVDPQFGPAMIAALATTVQDWVQPLSVDSQGVARTDPAGTASQLGLSLQFRWVDTDPLKDMNALKLTVPAVPGLAMRTAVTSSAFAAEQDQAWQDGAHQVASQTSAAAGQAATAATQLKGFRPPTGYSGISACISALIADLPTSRAVLLVASDGEENVAKQLAGRLQGVRVLWIMPCPSGDAQVCSSLQATWLKRLTQIGAAPQNVRFKRPESVDPELFTAFLRGD